MTTHSPSTSSDWDDVANGYTAEVDWLLTPFARHAVELAMVGPTAAALDVATGPGTLALELAPRVHTIAAVDFSAEMLERLGCRARARRLRNVRAVRADGQALPFRDGAFQAGFSLFGWMYFADRPKGLAELRRVLTPGAPLILSSWAPPAISPLMAAAFGALRAWDETLTGSRYDSNSLENPKRLAYELREAGFVNVAVHEHTIDVAYDSPAALWTGLVRTSATIARTRKQRDRSDWARGNATAIEYLRRELGDGPGTLQLTAWLGCSVR